MPAAISICGPCEICGRKAIGHHFGVLSCRACAAFFRRSVLISKFYKDCHSQKCKIFEDGKYKCKKCRLQKCFTMGMNPNKFQHDRDLISTSFQRPSSLQNFLGRPTFILCFEPDKASHIKTIIDVTYLIEKSITIMENVPLKPYNSTNSLYKMAWSFEEKLKKSQGENVEIVTKFGKAESIKCWEYAFLETASWFTTFSEFNELDISVKLSILKSVWTLWIQLAKLAETAHNRKKEVFGKNIYMFADDVCMDYTNYEIDISWCTNYSLEQIQNFMLHDVEETANRVVEQLMALSPTSVELNFMLVQLCLYHAGKTHQGQVLEAADRLMELQSDNLHEYYLNDMNMPNYSARLVQLMSVNRAIEKEFLDRRDKKTIAQLFDVLSIDFSDPDMFEFS